MNKFFSGLSAKMAVFVFGLIAVMALAACGGGGGVTPNPNDNGNGNGNNTPTTGTVAGSVLDAGLGLKVVAQADDASPEPIEGADVTLTESETGDVVDTTTTDENGEFEFEDVPANETYDVKVEVEIGDDLNGDGQPDSVETKSRVRVKAGKENRCDTELSTEDSSGDGNTDSLVVNTNIDDSNGQSRNRNRQRHRDGQTDLDEDGDGNFDTSIDDNDHDGIDDNIDGDDDNDGIDDSADADSNDDGVSDATEFEIKGAIEAVGEGTITIGGVTYAFDELTRMFRDYGEALSVDELIVGAVVEVEGYQTEDGSFYATKIKLETEDDDDSDAPEFEVKGAIEALSEGTITIAGVTYSFDESTRLLDDNGNEITLEQLLVGLFVELEGHETETGTFHASKIKIESEDDSGNDDTGGDDDGGMDDDGNDDTGGDDDGGDDTP